MGGGNDERGYQEGKRKGQEEKDIEKGSTEWKVGDIRSYF